MKGQARPWNAFDEDVLRQLHANGWGMCEIAVFMACGKKTIRERGAALGLTWTDGRFQPGQPPANKGLRRPGWAPGRMASTQFKKGQMAGAAQRNYQPIGTERISKDGYLERKVTDDHPVPARRWVGVHRLVWEAANGPIPPGHAVAFREGKRTAVAEEITVDRLELVSRVELMRRNSYHNNYPKEVAQLIQLKGALNRKINRLAGEKA